MESTSVPLAVALLAIAASAQDVPAPETKLPAAAATTTTMAGMRRLAPTGRTCSDGPSSFPATSARVTDAREHNLLEAWLRGWSVLCTVIAATLAFVVLLVVVCGAAAPLEAIGGCAALVLAAVVLRAYARLARTP